MTGEWDTTPLGLTRIFSFRTYDGLRTFVEEITRLASITNHHPDVSFDYSSVTVTFITHDAGNKITDLDTNSAILLDSFYAKVPQR